MKRKIRVAVMASGRGSNFDSLSRSCKESGYPARIELLIVDNEDAGAIEIAKRREIDTVIVDCGSKRGSMTPESSEEITRICSDRGVDLICLAGFMRIVKGKLMEEYRGRILNIHPSLLPSFKGLRGQRQAIEYGVRYSGCTVHFVDSGVDTGPIIIQRIVAVQQGDDEEALSERILAEEHKAYPEAVRLFAEGRLIIEGRRVSIKDDE